MKKQSILLSLGATSTHHSRGVPSFLQDDIKRSRDILIGTQIIESLYLWNTGVYQRDHSPD